MKDVRLTDEMYDRLQVCLRFCEEDLLATEGFLETAFAEYSFIHEDPRKRTTLPKVQELQRAVQMNTQEGVL